MKQVETETLLKIIEEFRSCENMMQVAWVCDTIPQEVMEVLDARYLKRRDQK